jgi:hypothetical protein
LQIRTTGIAIKLKIRHPAEIGEFAMSTPKQKAPNVPKTQNHVKYGALGILMHSIRIQRQINRVGRICMAREYSHAYTQSGVSAGVAVSGFTIQVDILSV